MYNYILNNKKKEKRKYKRHHSSAIVIIKFKGCVNVLEGRLINHSLFGARIRLAGFISDVSIFEMAVQGEDKRKLCIPVWKRHNEMGVRFLRDNEEWDDFDDFISASSSCIDEEFDAVDFIKIAPRKSDAVVTLPGAPVPAPEDFKNLSSAKITSVFEPISFGMIGKASALYNKIHILTPDISALGYYIPEIYDKAQSHARKTIVHLASTTKNSGRLEKNSAVRVRSHHVKTMAAMEYEFMVASGDTTRSKI